MRLIGLCLVLGSLLLGPALPARAMVMCTEVSDACCLDGECCTNGHLLWIECVNGVGTFKCQWDLEYGCGGYCVESEEYPCNCYNGGFGGGTCLLAGTPITLADGTTKPVEAVRTGDSVLAYEETGKTVRPGSVTAVHPPREVDGYLVLNENLRLTANHLLLSDGKWVQAGELKVGSFLTAVNGAPIPIVSVRKVKEKATVYNFQVSDGTYVAGGVIVHNKPLPYTIYPVHQE